MSFLLFSPILVNFEIICKLILEALLNEFLKEKAKGKTLTNESGIRPDIDAEASTLKEYECVLEEFTDNKLKVIEMPSKILQFAHSGLNFGKEQIEIWLQKKEIEGCHVSLYIRLVT